MCVCGRVFADVCVCDCVRRGEGLMNEYGRVCACHVCLSMCVFVCICVRVCVLNSVLHLDPSVIAA